MSSPQWNFADFRLDPDNACLWHGTQAVILTPKAFDVLHYLVSHADRLVTKDMLLDAVWPETAISDVIATQIADVGDSHRAGGGLLCQGNLQPDLGLRQHVGMCDLQTEQAEEGDEGSVELHGFSFLRSMNVAVWT